MIPLPRKLSKLLSSISKSVPWCRSSFPFPFSMFNPTFLPPPEPGIDTTDHIPNPYPMIPNYLIGSSSNYHSGFEASQQHLDLEFEGDEQPLINNIFEASNNSSFAPSLSQSQISQEMASTGSSPASFNVMPMYSSDHLQEESKRAKKGAEVEDQVVVIRTKTRLDTLYDGYKWRKYGKKSVKSNPNLRHYYKCLNGGCKVKKTVERDGEDSSYLITTYTGRHNHAGTSFVYCDRLPSPMMRPSQSH